MANVIAGITTSLDGFVNDANGDVSRLYLDFAELRDNARMQETMRSTGAVVMGRHAYDMANGDFTDYEFQTPIFVLTHQPPAQPAKGENDKLRFTFVTDGIESAIRQAKAAAGDKDVTVIGGASTIQQCLKSGLVDYLEIDVMPVILGGGTRLFEHLQPITLERLIVDALPSGRTSLKYQVVR
jgi:dihydrofolate reductase